MKPMYFLVLATCLSGCGGGSSDSKENPGPVSYDNLQAPKPSTQVLEYATSTELTTLLKNGVRRDFYGVRGGEIFALENNATDDALAAEASPAPNANDFSGTNVQVAGVDEADYVKYDGQYMYLHVWPDWQEDETNHGVRILRTDVESAAAEQVSEIEFTSDGFYGDLQLYLLDGAERADALVSLTSGGYVGFCGTGDIFNFGYYNSSPAMKVSLHDLEDPANPSLDWELELDGILHNSRKIGDMLYLVTSYLPQLAITPEVLRADSSEESSEQAVADLDLDDLLPGYSVNGGERQQLHTSEECLVGADTNEHYGYRSLHHIVAVDLRNKAITRSVCLGTPVEGLYSSTEAIYLGATQWGNNWEDSYTVLHKFSLANNDITYVATGSVPGTLGWSSPSFRMDEYQDNMRVLTTARSEAGDLDHRLWVLEENADTNTLDLISTLPAENAENSDIGKPGEDVYAVRFFGDRAYVVTFERTDPLYVLDLSDPAQPLLAGELELPGFSTYLHPLEEGYLFGFGQDADSEGRATGLKAALFDVRDSANPKTVSEISMGGRWSWSDALYDHKAFNFLPAGESGLRITFPVTLANGLLLENGVEQLTVADEYSRMLVLLEANGLDGDEASMTLQGTLQPEVDGSREWYDYSALSRGILHGNSVFYVDEPEVWGAFWTNPDDVFGPY